MIDFYPPEFASFPTEIYAMGVESPCSPKNIDSHFNGILIRVPERVRLPRGEALMLPVCGFYQLSTGPLVTGAEMWIHLSRVGVLFKGKPVSAKIVILPEHIDDHIIPPPDDGEVVSPEMFENQISMSYFHLNAPRYFAEPIGYGTYDVYVTYGDDKSNVARVKIEKP